MHCELPLSSYSQNRDWRYKETWMILGAVTWMLWEVVKFLRSAVCQCGRRLKKCSWAISIRPAASRYQYRDVSVIISLDVDQWFAKEHWVCCLYANENDNLRRHSIQPGSCVKSYMHRKQNELICSHQWKQIVERAVRLTHRLEIR